MVEILLKMAVEKYLRCVVPAEMPASWHMEALKAQAVIARTYALLEMKNGEYLHDDEHSQVYDCTFMHKNSDKAIIVTTGEYVWSPDATFTAEYVNKCGLDHCPYCKGKGGHDDKVWTGRLCQFGSDMLADRGLDYKEILQFYYGCDIEIRRYHE